MRRRFFGAFRHCWRNDRVTIESDFSPGSDEMTPFIGTIALEPAAPEDSTIDRETREEAERLLLRLPTRVREVVSMRFGLGNAEPATLAEIAGVLGVIQTRAGQLETRAMARLGALRAEAAQGGRGRIDELLSRASMVRGVFV